MMLIFRWNAENSSKCPKQFLQMQETKKSYQTSRTRALVLYLQPTVREEVWFENSMNVFFVFLIVL